MADMGRALGDRLRPYAPNLLFTAEASGIAPALATAFALDVPLVYAKKYAPAVEFPARSRLVPSPTKGGTMRLVVAARYLPLGTRVAIVDNFLAKGKTALALTEIVTDARAHLVAVAFLVEKTFQGGRALLDGCSAPVIALVRWSGFTRDAW